MVLTDVRISEMFSHMPKISHECTQVLWRDYRDKPFNAEMFRKITQEGAFQKLEYKSLSAREPRKGTFADHIVKGT
jgi:hypothetical protein